MSSGCGQPRGYVVGVVVVVVDHDWRRLLTFVSGAFVLSFAFQTLALAVIRRSEREARGGRSAWLRRRVAVDGVPLAAFVVTNELVLFGTWDIDWVLLLLTGAGTILLSLLVGRSWRALLDPEGAWLLPYLLGLAVISALSSFRQLEAPGRGVLPFGADVGLMAGFSVAIYAAAMACPRPAPPPAPGARRGVAVAGDLSSGARRSPMA